MSNYIHFSPEIQIWFLKNMFIKQNLEKNASEVEKMKILGILVFKIFCLFSQFQHQFQLQVSGPS